MLHRLFAANYIGAVINAEVIHRYPHQFSHVQ